MGQGISQSQLRVHVPVANGIFICALLQIRLHYAIVLSGSTLRYFVVRDIGNLAEQTRHLLLGLIHGFFQLLVGFLHFRHLCLDSVSLGLLSFLHQTTNLRCHLFGFAQVLVQLLLGLATLFVNGQHFINGFFGTLKVFLL